MGPERLLGKNPARNAAYIVMGLSLVVIALASWNVTLDRRLDEADVLRALETKQASSECRARIAATRQANDVLQAVRDLARIPQSNLRDNLETGFLTPRERADRVDALHRYQEAEMRITTLPLPACVRSAP